MEQAQPQKKQFSTASRVVMLSISILWAVAEFAAGLGTSDVPYMLGYSAAPLIWSFLGVGVVWQVAKLVRKTKQAPFKRPFVDYFAVSALAFTLLTFLSRVMAASQRLSY